MKIVYYCQHVLGMGHYFRSLEICRAFKGHEVILVSGGASMNMPVPAHVREVNLPPLGMDPDFSGLESDSDIGTVEQIKAVRQQTLYELFLRECPDLFMVELFPFGRKAFGFELIPVFSAIRQHRLCPSRVVCSLRDVLVEKKDTQAYESRVITALNQWFDALLIHSDAAIVKLDETFSRIADIRIPVVYTGFVTPRPGKGDRAAIRHKLGIGDDSRLIVASAGGGKVGFVLLDAVIRAFEMISLEADVHLQVFTGPFMESDAVRRLQEMGTDRIMVSRFTPDFPAYLCAADLSVSMAGYNTCMNILAARVPSLVWPFSQNREQRLRSEHISEMGGMRILEDSDLEPRHLAELMTRNLIERVRPRYPVDLDGAVHTANWTLSWMEKNRNH
ncbi:MAG: glycosyl transferase [Deltaproteobacteria bacterium]|nr:glycosyl transferase [Deltaproteobacteria bacterium]